MTLVDTSVWIDHIRRPDARLIQLLANDLVAVHPFVIGELFCGNLKNRSASARYLRRLPSTSITEEHEVHRLLEAHHLWGRGMSWVDLHILASAALNGYTVLSSDHAMNVAAIKLGIAYPVN